MLNGAKKNFQIMGIKRLEPMSHVTPMPLTNRESQQLDLKRHASQTNGAESQPSSTTVQTYHPTLPVLQAPI